MAETKTGGRSRMGKDARPKYLGVKISDGQVAEPGNIIVRQRGTKFVAGKNIRKGRDDTLYAAKAGKVFFVAKNKIGYDSRKKKIKIVSIK
ncbi:MAG: 50S ribosomal protein L27 [Patescibacteria group bacterium]